MSSILTRSFAACGFTALTALPMSQAHAAPLSEAAKDVHSQFSADMQDKFYLLGDTDDDQLVYYIPRRGAVAVQSPQSDNPIPRFSILSRIPSFGFFAGYELTQMGGSFSTTGDLGALSQLQAEAAAKHLRVAPAPVSQSAASFAVAGQVDPVTGRIDVQCEFEESKITASDGTVRTIKAPICKTRQNPDEDYGLDTNVMYKFAFTPLANNSTSARDVSFQATTLPDVTPQLRTLMQTGAQWDGVITSNVNWVVRTSNLTRQARAHINWQRTLEQASTFAAVHINSCVDAEVKAFFSKIVDCTKEDECGVRMEYLQADGKTWGDRAPNDANFINVVNELDRDLRRELFNEIKPKLGPVSTQTSSVFTLRANYEKLIVDRNEIRYLTYNPGPTDFEAETRTNISCLMGGYEDGRVTWNLDDAGCVALLGR
jgi:hypothetical protein